MSAVASVTDVDPFDQELRDGLKTVTTKVVGRLVGGMH